MHIGIVHLYDKSFPPDIRIEKEIVALAKAGHRVTILARKTKSKEKEIEEYDNRIIIKRVMIERLGKCQDILSRFSLLFRNCFSKIRNFIEYDKPDALHVHDFGLVPTVLKIAAEYRLPLIADLHENMPAALVASRYNDPIIKRFIRSISLNYYVWRWHEAQSLKKCYKIIVVVQEAAKRLLDYGIKKNKIIVVSNTEDETTFETNKDIIDEEILNKYRKNWVVSYIGGLGPHRGIDTALESIALIGKNIPALKVLIVGAKKSQMQQLLEKTKNLGINSVVEIIEWQPFDKVKSYIIASKVCLVPHNNFEHTHTTVPHKLFQYMICKKPVLVSDCRPLKRIVDDTKAGVVFKANNSQDCAKKLIYMYQSPELLVKMGENGKNAALGRYAWRHDAARLIKMYAELEHKIGISDEVSK
jgi:glycosyltransferase involved in cell wall biosynthesis